jgi:hypothetical protein
MERSIFGIQILSLGVNFFRDRPSRGEARVGASEYSCSHR